MWAQKRDGRKKKIGEERVDDETLCKFEMYFPLLPAFFDIMVHLIVHLVREIKLCGPVFLRWCYPFERYMGTLKDKVRNPVSKEISNFVAESFTSVDPVGLPTSRDEGRLEGKGTIGSIHLYVKIQCL